MIFLEQCVDWLDDPMIFPTSILTRLLYNYIYINQTTQRTSAFRFVIHLSGVCICSNHVHNLFYFILQKYHMDDFLRCVVFEFVIKVTGKLIARVTSCQVFLSIFSSKLGSYSIKMNFNSNPHFQTHYRFNIYD